MRRAVPFALCLTLAPLPLGCGSGAETPRDELLPGTTLTIASADGAATGHVSAEGGRIVEGQNTILVDFEPSTTELVTVSALMPVHGHGIVPPSVSRTATGYRVGNVIFSMSGLWDVFLDVRVSDTTDRIEFTVDVP